MLRRFFAGNENYRPQVLEELRIVERLLELRTPGERSKILLKHLATVLPGDVRGYVVRGNTLESYSFEAVCGYSPELLELHPLHGPWRDPGPRLIPNLVQELFTPNDQEMRTVLGSFGLRDVLSSLVVPVASNGVSYGTLVLHRHEGLDFHEEELKQAASWGNILAGIQVPAHELRRTLLSLVEFSEAFVEAVEAQDFTQLGHGKRVTAYALAMGRALALSREQQADLYFAAMLHDIGKLGSGMELSVEDTQHPQRGANLVASSGLLKNAADGIRSHHENWDGTGFPEGLRKEDIPLLGRIVAVADIFDFLSSERGQALPLHEVEKGLESRSGRELDPTLVSLMINILRKGKTTAELAKIADIDLPF